MKTLNQMMKKKSEKIGFTSNMRVYQQPENEGENQPLDQHRRLALDINMIAAREENLGSTRSLTLQMRSPSNQGMERVNINMDNWIQETCYISVVTSGPHEPSNFNEAWNHQCPNERRKWREATTKNYTVWKTTKSGRTYIKLMCQMTEG